MIAPSLALPLAIALPLVAGSALAVAAGRRSGRAAAWALAWVTAATLGIVLAVAPAVLAGQPVAVSWPWVPALGLHLSLRLDGLALLFAGLILGIGLLVILYARYYLGPADPPGKVLRSARVLHGRNARGRAGGQSAAPRGVLGAHAASRRSS